MILDLRGLSLEERERRKEGVTLNRFKGHRLAVFALDKTRIGG